MQSSSKSAVALTCGIISLAGGIVGSIVFGALFSVITLVCGIIAVVAGVGAKKETNGMQGGGGVVCGILGIVFSCVFALGCTFYCVGTDGDGCFGILGQAVCEAENDGRYGMVWSDRLGRYEYYYYD